MASDAISVGLDCGLCGKPLCNPHMLPCIHIYCLSCLRDECRENSPDKFFCPLCVADKGDRKSCSARPWHAFEKIIENEAEQEAIQRRLAELPASKARRDSSYAVDYNEEADSEERKASLLKPPVLSPCSMHADKLADTFCAKCNQLACHKCISSFHRRCQDFCNIQEAIDRKRDDMDSIYSSIANNLALCQTIQEEQKKKLKDTEDVRTSLLLSIKMFRGAMVKLIMAKEKALIDEVDMLVDQMMGGAAEKEDMVKRLSGSFSRQLEVLNFSFSVNGQGELLPYLPSLATRLATDTKRLGDQRDQAPARRQLKFHRDDVCFHALESSALGSIKEEGAVAEEAPAQPESPEGKAGLTLTLLTSFHGGTRDDVVDPLLTDLVLLMNGDVIVTDRDNKCVKKFNQSGKLLTRVLIDAVPSRVAVVSNGRAAVSVMNKKTFYFLSLFGTIRILASVPVKKLYSFLAADGRGHLAAATNLCDCVDLLTEKGELIRTIFSQKSERATISRPIYLAPIRARDPCANGQPETDFIISDSGRKCVFRVDHSGQVAFTLKSLEGAGLECPLGVTVHESGLALFADRDGNTVASMDATGGVVKRVIGAEDGLAKPCGIYAGQRGFVALTQVDGMIKIYASTVVSL